MKKIVLLLALFVSIGASFSQIMNPTKWKTSVEKINETEYMLNVSVKIDSTWHLYAQKVPKGGPIPTQFAFTPTQDYELIGNTIEETGHIDNSKVFKMKIKYFDKKAVFKQKVKLMADYTKVEGSVTFMVCNDIMCLPPKTVDLIFELPKAKVTKKDSISKPEKTIEKLSVSDKENNEVLYGITKEDIKLYSPASSDNALLKGDTASITETTQTGSTSNTSKSLFSIFFIAFLSGFAALLTPCIFPMIPMTVSYFTKQSKDKAKGIKNATIYGISIIAIYVFLGYVVTLIFGADSLNALSTNVWFNLIFFAILVVFAISFFGFFEITLPSSWSTKIDSQADRSGFIGIFFMALALAVVSFSCTGPIVGTLLVEAASKGGIAPMIGMLGFSLAIAVPFALFAAFPGWLNSLPQSGGWMNTVKVVLGFLELALAFKFLSNADLVAHWNLFKYEPFMIVWIITFGGLALYLFGKIKFPHDSPKIKLSFPRVAFGILVASFTIYLMFGFRYSEKTKTFKPLSLLSGLAPPAGYSYIHPVHCPNNLDCFKDLKEGMAYAKKVNKPIMLDFTGYACVNCRKMEEHVWIDPRIDDILRNRYVLISLYVDDKKELPQDQQLKVVDVDGSIRTLKNYGHKWSHFQATFFNRNSQPHYVLVSPDGKRVLNEPVGHTPDKEVYYNWLQNGLKQ